MEDKIRRSLDEAIAREMERLRNASDEEKQQAMKVLTELYKMRIEERKIEQGKIEMSTKAQSQNLDRWLNVGTTVGVALLNVVALSAAFGTSIKYDHNGTLPSYLTRNLFTKLLPRR